MGSIKVSVIIPVYQVEDCIVECLESVYSQDYPNIEIVIVNDATPDSSFIQAKAFIQRQSKPRDVILIEHHENKGLSAARNTGMKASTGDYIFFLDSDDMLCVGSISKLVEKCVQYEGVDIVQGNFKYLGFGEIERIKFDFPEYTDDKHWIKKHYLGELFAKNVHVPRAVWNKLIRRDMVIGNEMWFKEGIIFEDNHWRMVHYKHVSSMAFCSDITYVYRFRPGSITHSYSEHENWTFRLTTFHDFIPVIERDDDATFYLLFVQMLDYMEAHYNRNINEAFCSCLSELRNVSIHHLSYKKRMLLVLIQYSLKVVRPMMVKRVWQIFHYFRHGSLDA